MGDSPASKNGGAANPRWSKYLSYAMAAVVVLVIAMVAYGFYSRRDDSGENRGERETASAESRSERPSIASAAVEAVLPGLSPVAGQETCRSDAGVLKTLAPGESMRVRGAGGTTFFFPSPATEEGSRLIRACSLIDRDNCQTPTEQTPRGNFRVWLVTNVSDGPVEVSCIWEPNS